MPRIRIENLDASQAIDPKMLKHIMGGSDHDDYANQDTQYLLDRIEGFRPLALLASNLKTK